ncbi:multidrug MFS transporter [Lactiplantibacillus fabifermentans T30PCM01]|uniref:Multidrug MFS transporter n=1 Tax=Lactiplantibacillus fabifermentans T30PCM01 TaxID=1400520 RepID=W6T3T0_9LACO|nr:MDR family MFS transporter [Lactiplantibacillus fabifermentans]ETY72551.1 multidrug MFS transporter [Lactiplantibacillus fabifermentans T30PCM01]
MQTTQSVDVNGRPYHRGLMLALALFATFAAALMQTSLGTALPRLMTVFDINLSTAQQATTWFLLANAIMVPVSAFLIKRFSVRTLSLAAYSCLAIGIAISAFTPANHQWWLLFVVGRIVAALAVGVMFPLLQIMIVNMYAPKERGLAMGMMGLVVGMAPALGPTLTGWILDQKHVILGITISNSWRTIFYLPLIVIIIALLFCPFLIKDVLPKEKVHLDFWSLLASTVGFGLFLLGFTNVAADGWTDFSHVVAPIVGGLILIGWLVWRQLKLEHPFLDVRVFKSRSFTLTTIILVLATMAMMGVEMMLPTYLQTVHNLSALNSGLTLLPGALLMGLFSPIAGRLYDQAGIKRLVIAGFTILALGTIPFAFISMTTSTLLIIVMYALRMIGIALVLMPLTSEAMAALPLEKSTDGTAVNNTARQVASSVGTAVLTSITQNVINQHQPSHHLKLSDPLAYADKYLQASMDGFQVAFMVGLAFAVAGLILAFWLKHKEVHA